jgi:hypothetical protein
MATPDPDHPSTGLTRISAAVNRRDWVKLRQHALGESIDAQAIVAELIHQYVAWPPALQAATLKAVREAQQGQ